MLKILILAALFFNVPGWAQSGRISGIVTCDGAPIVATVVLTSQAVDQQWTTTAQPDGSFEIRNIPPGDYRLAAQTNNCQGDPTDVLHLNAGEAKKIDLSLSAARHPSRAKPPDASDMRPALVPPPPPRRVPAAPPRPPMLAQDAIRPAGQKFTTIRIFYATDRQQADTSQPSLFYGGARRLAASGAAPYELGQCDVSIPFDHEVGELESPVWWKAEFRPDPELHIVLLSVTPEDNATYFNAMRQRVSGSPSKDAFVFIHGYNTTFEDAARRTAQMAYDLKFQGAPILYSWPSQGELAKYTFDENNVEWTWRHLYDFLQALSQQSGATTIHLIAHSMGNRALTNALQRMPKSAKPVFREVILAAPDIDADLFRQMAADMQGKANRITLYASSKDDALKASKAAHGEPRAGDSDNIVIVDGVDSIDASAAATDFLGHGYVFKNSILFDMNNLFKQGKPPQERDRLTQERLGTFLYWLLAP